MKLFTPTEVVTNKERQATVDLKRIGVINSEIAKKRQELDAVTSEFEKTLERQRENWEKEQAEAITVMNILNSEVQVLEERKRQALMPLQEKEKELNAFQTSLEERDVELASNLSRVESHLERLEEKLSQVAEREVEVARIAKIQENRQKGIDMQSEQIKQQSKALTESIKTSFEVITERENELAKRELELTMRTNALISRENELNNIEQSFKDRERVLQDKYETLQRTIERNKNI